jgi:hypothetical protein
MKKYIIFFTLVIGAFFVSCSDMLELDNDGRITMDEVFKTRNGVQGYLNACYNYRIGPSFDRAALTDDAQNSDDMYGSSLYNYWYANAYSATDYANTDGSPWSSLYQGIRKCNVFLTNMAVLDPSSIMNYDNEISSWVAQAHTLRAYYYLELIKRYGACPIITEPYATTHDFSKDLRSPVSEVVAQIAADCDEALSAPEGSLGFSWLVTANQKGIMTRAMAHFIKAQALLFAASPQFADGTYSWADARDAAKTALGLCLANGYELFDVVPQADVAQNAYAYYFISASDEQQAFDKEAIYPGSGLNIWGTNGLPSTAGQTRAGACPTQELVDCYEMQATGEPPVNGYSDEQHLNPIINTASGYDPENPYEGRDPRFYATIYYNGASRLLGLPGGLARDDHFPLTLNGGDLNQITFSESDGEYKLESTGGDPYITTSSTGDVLNAPPGTILIRLQYKSSAAITTGEFFFCMPNAAAGFSTGQNLKFPQANDWTDWELDITSWASNFGWGKSANHRLRFDFTTNPNITFYVRNMEVVVQSSIQDATPVQTYIGGADALSQTDRRYTHTGYYVRKYNNWKSSKDNSADGQIRKFRLAELYLNFAEAAYQADGPDTKIALPNGTSMSARDAVNAIRSRAGMPDFPSGMSKEAFEKKYRNERRVELAFEDNRYFDVRRWKIMPETSRYVTGMRITESGGSFTYQRFSIERYSYGDKYYLYPLSITEVNKMKDLTGVEWQNPGW